MTILVLAILLGLPVIIGITVFVTTRIVWKKVSKRTEMEISNIKNEYNKTKKDDEKLISALKDVIEAQDEQISELKNHL